MIKKLMSIVLSAVIFLSVLSGCQSISEGDKSDNIRYYTVKEQWTIGDGWIYE